MKKYLFCSLLLAVFALHAAAALDRSANRTDANGLRQGYWRITGQMTIEEGYDDYQLVEEGSYVDNKREGLWKKYFPNGKLKSAITYAENRPYGHYSTYYDNGVLQEEGFWKLTKNTGEFKRYHPNGKLAQHFHFNSDGKRDGEQLYYYDSGLPHIALHLDHGVAHGEYLAFYPDGQLREKKRYTNGEVELGSTQVFESGKPYAGTNQPVISAAERTPATQDKPNLEEFKADGFNTLYNRNKQLTQVGQFRNGRLWEGKWYKYDEHGLLRRLEFYKGGRFIGYGILEDSDK